MKYELTLVLGGKATAAKKKAVGELITKSVAVKEGKVVSDKDWGEIELSYPLYGSSAGKRSKFTTGSFLFYVLEVAPEVVKLIDDKVKAEKDIVRHLIVKV